MRIRWTFYGVPWMLVVTGVLLLASRYSEATAQQARAESSVEVTTSRKDIDANQVGETQFVILTVDYGDGFQKRFVKIAWQDGMSILDVMQGAKKHKRAKFDFQFQGQGATALLSKIDDVSNMGGGQRNWIFYVNNRKGDRSFSIWKLQPGDEVLWRFEKYL